MATLSRVTKLTRAVLKWGAIFIVSLFILNILLKVGGRIKNNLFPPPPPAPTVAFGKLPPPEFPENKITSKLSYTLDTVSGALPTMPTQVDIYKIVKSQPALLSLQKARERVSRTGFTKGERQQTNRIYLWTDVNSRTIKFDIISDDFDLTSDFLKNPKVTAAENLPNQDKAKTIAIKFLDQLEVLKNNLDTSNPKISFLAIKDGLLISTTSFSNAQIIRIDLPQKDINDIPIVYPDKDTSLANFLIGGNTNEEQSIVQAHYFYREPDLENPSTYPIKTIDQAFEELKSNQAFIVNLDNKKAGSINIKKVSLGYYLSPETQDFFYPVYAFEGDNGFLGYIWAIDPSWTQQPSQ